MKKMITILCFLYSFAAISQNSDQNISNYAKYSDYKYYIESPVKFYLNEADYYLDHNHDDALICAVIGGLSGAIEAVNLGVNRFLSNIELDGSEKQRISFQAHDLRLTINPYTYCGGPTSNKSYQKGDRESLKQELKVTREKFEALKNTLAELL